MIWIRFGYVSEAKPFFNSIRSSDVYTCMCEQIKQLMVKKWDQAII